LLGRANLARVYVLVDARHGLKDTDAPILDALGKAAVSHQVVLTKSDAVTADELARRVDEVGAALTKRPAAFPAVLATSAREKGGIDEVRAAVARLLAERKH
jgi:GTP-binding protein